MSLKLRWVGDKDRDRIIDVRLRAFGHAETERERFEKAHREDPRERGKITILAEDGGQDVGTAAGYLMTMWVRGSAIPSQGVAYVGTIKTHRRGKSGVASSIMREIVRGGRERGAVVTALMPFRASFYQHFGYGIVERRNEWTIPTTIFPHGDFSSLQMATKKDREAIKLCRQRYAQSGQCDSERPDGLWDRVFRQAQDGFIFVDRPQKKGLVSGWMHLKAEWRDGFQNLRVAEAGYEDHDALMRQLWFVGSLRDQYNKAIWELPSDLPLNHLLREREISFAGHGRHSEATCRVYSRMQMRVLDHKKFLEALHLPKDRSGKVSISVAETEGEVSRFGVEIDSGRAKVTKSGAGPAFESPDHVWAAVASGDLMASRALQLGLAKGDGAAGRVLDVLAEGPAPFSNEYF